MKRLFITISLFATSLIVIPTTATAQTATPNISISSMPAWYPVGSEARLNVSIENATNVKSLRLQVYSRMTNDTQITNWTEKYTGRSVIRSISADVTAQPKLSYTFVIPADDPLNNTLDRSGVYPIRISAMSASGQRLSDTRSFLLSQPTPSSDESRIGVVIHTSLLPIASVAPDGSAVLSNPDRGLLNSTISVLANHTELPISITTFGDTAAALNALPTEDATKAAMLSLLANVEVIGGQWAPSPAISTTPKNLQESAALAGSQLETLLGHEPQEALLADNGYTESMLNQRTIPIVLFPSSATTPRAESLIRRAGATVDYLPYLSTAQQLLTNNSRAGVQNALAAVTMRYLVRPNQTNRHFVITTPSAKNLSPGNLNTWITALSQAGFLHPETIAQQQEQTATIREMNTVAPVSLTKRGQSVREQAVSDVADFASFTLPDNPELESIEQSMSTASGAWLKEAQQRVYWQVNRDRVAGELAKIDPPPNSHIRLTAKEVVLPITVSNTTGNPVKLELALRSPRVQFVDGSTRTLIIDRDSKTAKFQIRARTSGTFPIKVELRSLSRNVVLAQSEITIDAFATTHVGIYLSIAALVVLALWWSRYIWRRRKSEHA